MPIQVLSMTSAQSRPTPKLKVEFRTPGDPLCEIYCLRTMLNTTRRGVAAVFLLALFASCLVFFVLGGVDKDARKCPDADAVDHNDNRALNEKLRTLTSGSTFFSIFRAAIDKKCPFWADDMKCAIRDCSVCNCADNEIPPAWRQDPPTASRKPCPTKKALNKLNDVDRSLPSFLTRAKRRQWERGAHELVWTVQDSEQDAQYVDLRKNPEQYTGYTGTHANSVWGAIYNENCFEYPKKCKNGICEAEVCKEERVLYRLISGVHTSITAHLAKRFLFSNDFWGENSKIYRYRIAVDPERPRNLNVAFALVARAVAKASSTLNPNVYEYVTGDEKNDEFTKTTFADILKSPLLDPNCQKPTFDESDMFVESTRHRLPEFRAKFRNISKIMDCVGCEKCRLWGKLQFLGLGTALRILFDDTVPKLERNEVIALINLLHKLSSSVLWVDRMETLERRSDSRFYVMTILAATVVGVLLVASSTSVLKQAERTAPVGEQEQQQSEDSSQSPKSKSEIVEKPSSSTIRKRARHVPIAEADSN